MKIRIPVSVGELVDRITILEIKLGKVEQQFRKPIINEYDQLIGLFIGKVLEHVTENQRDLLVAYRSQLSVINLKLWELEDQIRRLERDQDFGDDFLRAARAIYKTNDTRSRVKKSINTISESDIVEVKSYVEYD